METPQERAKAPESPENDAELATIVAEEEKVLSRVLRVLADRAVARAPNTADYDAQLLALRDQIAEARMEDVPPLVEEMERLQQVAARRAEVVANHVDLRSPYFGRLVLEEGPRKREVLIGRGTYLDSRTGVRIVDWRDAPVSRLYYRYDEGDEYEENFGGKRVDGEVITRRSLAIAEGALHRIGSPQGSFLRNREGTWRRAADTAVHLKGGQGTALRAEEHHRPKRLGAGQDGGRDDRFLPEITALIDPRQFELIAKPSSGLVVIQGGAGSGKTTIGLHRMAYLAFQAPKHFRADKMLVLVFNDALARYISRVLPALGVEGVAVATFARWAEKMRKQHLFDLPEEYTNDTPAVVSRLKKHPAMLRLMDAHVARMHDDTRAALVAEVGELEGGAAALAAWDANKGLPIAQRAEALERWATNNDSAKLPTGVRHASERVAKKARREGRDVVGAWAEILTSRALLAEHFGREAPEAFTAGDLEEAFEWCKERCTRAQAAALPDLPEPEERESGSEDDEEPRDHQPGLGVDGRRVDEGEERTLDREDDALLLCLVRAMRGPLRRGREALEYSHIFVDEAQDLSPVELSVVLSTAGAGRSITLAGDTAQRMLMENGFTDWRGVLSDLGLAHVEVEPLRITYRSTQEIVDFALAVLGPLATEEPPKAPRHGAPVELYRFAHTGDAVGFLAEALRELALTEPRASVALISRYPEQADVYFKGLGNSEVPNLRRVANQDFSFKPGVDVTDVRQVKGLEFDYVVLLDVSTASYPNDHEARHLLHIAATRAAHQLWVTTSGEPSMLLPEALRSRGY